MASSRRVLLLAAAALFGCSKTISCAANLTIPAQKLPLVTLGQSGPALAAARGTLLQPPDGGGVPTVQSNLFQLGLNDPCFAGAGPGGDGGIGLGLSFEAFAEDLTDVQCRSGLNSQCEVFSLPPATQGQPVLGIPVSDGLTPVAFACSRSNGTGSNCTYSLAAKDVSCMTCSLPTPDAMGNPSGTFFGILGDGELFLRFPDSVSTPSLASSVTDVIGLGLFNLSELDPTMAPALSQSFHSCGGNSAFTNAGLTFNSISGWIRGLSLVPVMATNTSNLLVAPPFLVPSATPANNFVYLTLFIDDLDLEGLSFHGIGLGSAILTVQVGALLEVTVPLGICPGSVNLIAPSQVTVQLGQNANAGQQTFSNPTVSISAEAATTGSFIPGAIFTTFLSDTIAGAFQAQNGIELDTPGFCLTEAQVLPETGGGPGIVGVANLWNSTLDGGGPIVLGPTAAGTVPGAFLELNGFPSGDPPAPPLTALQVETAALAADIPVPPDAGQAGDPPPLPAPAPGQANETLGLTYQASPGLVVKQARLGLPDGGVQLGILTAPLWPVVTADLIPTAFLRLVPGVQGVPTETPNPPAGQLVLSATDDLLEGSGMAQALWPIPYRSFAGANEGVFFPLMGVTGEAVGRQAFVPGQFTSVTETVYTCSNDGGLGSLRLPITDAGPFAGYPIVVSRSGAQIVIPSGFLGADAGIDPPGDPSSGGPGSCTRQNGACSSTAQCCGGLACSAVAGASGAYCEDPPTAPCGLNTTNCPSGTGVSCVVTRTDPANCGGCGIVCPSGNVCTGGACVASTNCPQGRVACGSPATCVDPLTNSSFCSKNGSCGIACPAGDGCAGGKCVAVVGLSGIGPSYCQGSAASLIVAQGDRNADCTADLAHRAASNDAAICSCAGGTWSQTLTTDSYDSLLGPYAAGGNAGHVLVNGTVRGSQVFTVGGNLGVGGDLRLSQKGNTVDGNLFVGGALNVGSLAITGNAVVGGPTKGTLTVGGTLSDGGSSFGGSSSGSSSGGSSGVSSGSSSGGSSGGACAAPAASCLTMPCCSGTCVPNGLGTLAFCSAPLPPPVFDATPGNSLCVAGSSTTNVTVSIVAGETGFVTFSSNYASPGFESVTGGGQWTMIGSAGTGQNTSYTSLWTNGPGGGASASSISVTHDVGTYVVCVGQYTGVVAILSSNVATETTTSTGAPGITYTPDTVHAGSLVLAAFGDGFGPTFSADLGSLRVNSAAFGLPFGAALTDAPAPTTSGSVTEEVTLPSSATWSAVAVELTADPPPALCDCSNPINIAGIVASGAIYNDNAVIGLAPDVFVNPASDLHLDLPCGRYYLAGIRGKSPGQSAPKTLSISIHGSTVLFVGDDIDTSQPLEITVDATASLSLFVGGYIKAAQPVAFGSTEVPAQTNIYVAGTAGVSASNTQLFAANLYAPNGPLGDSNGLTVYGSIVVNGVSSSQNVTAHHDLGSGFGSAACVPPAPSVSLSQILPQAVLQEFPGPVMVQLFVPFDPDGGPAAGAGADAGPTSPPIPYVFVSNGAATFGAQLAGSDLPQTICKAQFVGQTTLPLTEFNSCGPCGSPPVTPPSGGCCWTAQQVSPAVLGIKDLLWDARQLPAPGQLYGGDGGIGGAVIGTPAAIGGFGVTGWPGDPDASYIVGQVGGDNGDGGFNVVGLLFQEPENDTIFVIGATDRLVTGLNPLIEDAGPPGVTQGPFTPLFTQQPIDVSCLIEPVPLNGIKSLVPNTTTTHSVLCPEGLCVVSDNALLNLCRYADNPSDEMEVFFQLPILDGGCTPLGCYENVPGALLPFQKAIAPGGGDECTFLDSAIASGNQPPYQYSASYGLPDPGQTSFTASFSVYAQAQNGGGSGCGPTWARIDAVGWQPGANFEAVGQPPLLAPGIVLQRLGTGQSQPPLQNGSAWWAMAQGLAFTTTLGQIVQNGFQINENGGVFQVVPQAGGPSCGAAECDAGMVNDACCIASGSSSLLPIFGFGATGPATEYAEDEACCSAVADLASGTCN